MKNVLAFILVLFSISSFSQDKDEQEILAQKKANDLVYDANVLVDNDDYVSAEMEYRKAISEQPNFAVGNYNLGNSYYKKGNFDEALYRHQQTAKHATSKDEKYRAFHNIGNILMQNKKCQEAAEAFKNALRNNPSDNETRYNYVLAKECAEQQQDENKDQDEDKKDEEKDQEQEQEEEQEKEEEEDENKENKPEDEGEKDKKEGEDKEDEEGKPKDENDEKGKGEKDEKKEQQQQPQPGQLSPQQIKNLLEAMNDQEQKVQDKMNEQKQKGRKVQTEKDW